MWRIYPCANLLAVCTCALSNGLYDSRARSTVGTLQQSSDPKVTGSPEHTFILGVTSLFPSNSLTSWPISWHYFYGYTKRRCGSIFTGCKEADYTHPNTKELYQSLGICWSLSCSSSSIALKVPEATVKLVFYYSDGTPVFCFPADPASTLVFSHSN